jgi:magnesium-transporting ATPase (P-type)
MQLFNIIFTSIPVILLGVVDWDINPSIDGKELNEYLPLLYYVGQNKSLFNAKHFFLSQFHGLIHSLIIFFFAFMAFSGSGILNSRTGFTTDLWTSSVAAFTALVSTVNFNLLIRMKFITAIHGLSFLIISFVCYIAFMWSSNYLEFGWTKFSVL